MNKLILSANKTNLKRAGIYYYNRCTKSPPICFGTPWMPSSGSVYSG